jgi:hypothetical protein
MLESAPIGTHADKFFGEPEFTVSPEARRKHMALFGGNEHNLIEDITVMEYFRIYDFPRSGRWRDSLATNTP